MWVNSETLELDPEVKDTMFCLLVALLFLEIRRIYSNLNCFTERTPQISEKTLMNNAWVSQCVQTQRKQFLKYTLCLIWLTCLIYVCSWLNNSYIFIILLKRITFSNNLCILFSIYYTYSQWLLCILKH